MTRKANPNQGPAHDADIPELGFRYGHQPVPFETVDEYSQFLGPLLVGLTNEELEDTFGSNAISKIVAIYSEIQVVRLNERPSGPHINTDFAFGYLHSLLDIYEGHFQVGRA